MILQGGGGGLSNSSHKIRELFSGGIQGLALWPAEPPEAFVFQLFKAFELNHFKLNFATF